jgi:hypothetical protein
MTIYYSSTGRGFYDTTLNYASLPDDIIEVTPEQHYALLKEINSNNKVIVVVDGAIQLKERPAPAKTWEQIRIQRNYLLAESDYTQLPDFSGDKEAWAAYRLQLRDITITFSTPDEVVFPQKPN